MKLKASDSNALLRTLSAEAEYDLKEGEVIIDQNGDYTISGTYEKTTGTDHVITVKKGVSATITLKGVSIETANANTVQMSCIELEEGADVTLVLSGMNNLYTVSNSGAAIHVPKGSSLTIRAGSDQDVPVFVCARLWSWNRRKQRRGTWQDHDRKRNGGSLFWNEIDRKQARKFNGITQWSRNRVRRRWNWRQQDRDHWVVRSMRRHLSVPESAADRMEHQDR